MLAKMTGSDQYRDHHSGDGMNCMGSLQEVAPEAVYPEVLGTCGRGGVNFDN